MKIKSRLILIYSSMILQSCSQATLSKSNITPLAKNDIINHQIDRKKDGMLFIKELDRKVDKLDKKGFIGGIDKGNDIRKQLMYVFYHSLRLKRSSAPIEQRVDFFENESTLIWQPVLTTKRTIEFKLKNLLTKDDPNKADNIDEVSKGHAPSLECKDNFLIVKKITKTTKSFFEMIEIDHLLRDNIVTIEIPKTIHQEKTEIMDTLVDLTKEQPERDAYKYWKRRNTEIND